MIARFLRASAALAIAAAAFGQTNVTPREIALVETKLRSANPYFQNVWKQVFTSRGLTFRPPNIVPLKMEMTTPCGIFQMGNSFYCAADNNIYLDASFLAEQMLRTASQTKTDGDYAAIVVAAHEFGHLVATQLGEGRPGTFESEQLADCFAGAVTRQAKFDGLLERGDLAEARFGLLIAGEIVTGGSVVKMIAEAQPGAHGGPNERINAFDRGYYVGPAACSSKLGNAGMSPAEAVIHTDTLAQMPAGGGAGCTWTNALGGLRVTSSSTSGLPCQLTFSAVPPLLPQDFRIEVTATLVSGDQHRGFGPTWGVSDLLYFWIRGEGTYEFGTLLGGTTRMPVFPGVKPGVVATGYNVVQRLALDIHRGEWGSTMIGYVNGKYAGLTDALPHDGGKPGVFLEVPGMTVVLSNLRVSRLSE